jgi:hypothetical protein
MHVKRSLLVGAAIATVGASSLGLAGVASADTASSSSEGTSIVDKIASKFNLSKDEVQAVFDEDRESRQAEREAEQKEKLAAAVSDGTLTQAQADHITAALAEIKTLRGDSEPRTESDETRQAIKEKMDALRSWAEENDIDMRDLMIGGPHGGGGPGPRGDNKDQ